MNTPFNSRSCWCAEYEAKIVAYLPQARLLVKVLGNTTFEIVKDSPALKLAVMRIQLECVPKVRYLKAGMMSRVSRKSQEENWRIDEMRR